MGVFHLQVSTAFILLLGLVSSAKKIKDHRGNYPLLVQSKNYVLIRLDSPNWTIYSREAWDRYLGPETRHCKGYYGALLPAVQRLVTLEFEVQASLELTHIKSPDDLISNIVHFQVKLEWVAEQLFTHLNEIRQKAERCC